MIWSIFLKLYVKITTTFLPSIAEYLSDNIINFISIIMCLLACRDNNDKTR